MTLSIFAYMLSRVATTTMGRCSSTRARGPCFISPARMPSLWIKATSLHCGVYLEQVGGGQQNGCLHLVCSCLEHLQPCILMKCPLFAASCSTFYHIPMSVSAVGVVRLQQLTHAS